MKITLFDSIKNNRKLASLIVCSGVAFTSLVGCGTNSEIKNTSGSETTTSSVVTEVTTTTTKKKATTTKTKKEQVIEANIDSKYEEQIKKYFRKNDVITQADLDSVTEFEIGFSNKDDLEYISLFNNLNTIKVGIDNYGDLYKIPVLNSVTKVDITTNGYFSKEVAELYINKFPNLEYLKSSNKNVVYEPGAVENMKQLKKFKLYVNQNCDIHFDELTFLDKISFNDIDAYDMAISFNSTELNTLLANNVDVEFANKQVLDEYNKVSDKLDEIVASLNINTYSTKEEKIDAVLRYTLDNFEYDETVLSQVGSGKDCSRLLGTFYIKGFLYGALEKDTQICGNYAAFQEALFDRIEEPEFSYMALSNIHAWNVINTDKSYYLDSTTLDLNIYHTGGEYYGFTKILDREDDYKYNCDWYMEDPSVENVSKLDDHNRPHSVNYIPRYINKTNFYKDNRNYEIGDYQKVKTLG